MPFVRYRLHHCNDFFDRIVTSAMEIVFSSAFICLLAGLCKNYSTIITKFGGHR